MASESIIVRNSDKATQDEADAASSVEPGHLVERTAGGDYQSHSVDAGATAVTPSASVFAGHAFNPELEKADSIPADARFTLWKIPRGSGVVVDAIAGASISENDYVVSNGDGTVRTAVDGEEVAVVGQAVEAAASGGDRVQIEV